MRHLLCVLLLFFSLAAFATDPPVEENSWPAIFETDRLAWYAKPGSLSVLNDIDGRPVFTFTGKELDKQTERKQVQKMRVASRECDAEEGTVFILDITGNVLQSAQFVFGAGNAISFAAEVLCSIGRLAVATPDQRTDWEARIASDPDPGVQRLRQEWSKLLPPWP